MFDVLNAFGFGSSFSQWIKTFYKNIKSTVVVNGSVTPWFEIERGCRQGDPLSPYIFVLCVEIMSTMIRCNPNIKGIIINQLESKIVQYADDTELTLEGDILSFQEVINTIEYFGKCSGLVLNTDKSSATWLGSKKNSNIKYLPHLKMLWNPDKFKILEIWFTNDLKQCIELNFNDKFTEIKMLYKIWLKRQLTPLGRIAILKSVILSKLVHLWLLLPNPPHNFINTLQKSIFQFVWNNKNDKISRKTSVKSINEGGIEIPDIKNFIKALKLSWLRKLILYNHKWKHILLTKMNLDVLEKVGYAIAKFVSVNKFWTDVFVAYMDFGKNIHIQNNAELQSEPIFCNGNIKIGEIPFCYKSWISKGVFSIFHMLNGVQFLTLQEFQQKYKIKTNFFTYNGCIQAIKHYINTRSFKIQSDVCPIKINKVMQIICSVIKGTKVYYNILMQDNSLPNCCAKWEIKLGKLSWKFIFEKVRKIKDIKLRWLQIRILHRILGTNNITNHMGIVTNNKCTFCKRDKENIQHIFWNCVYVHIFWNNLWSLVKNKCEHTVNIQVNEELVLFGYNVNSNTDTVFDLILLLAKSYIYKHM